MPEHFLVFIYTLIFLAVPLSISGVSYVFMKIGAYDENIRYSLGFSGIVWALLGFLFFLAAVFLTRILYLSGSGDVSSRKRYFSYYFYFIFVLSILIFFPVFFIIADMETTINLYAHLAGFTYGWIVPPLLGFYLLSSDKLMKAVNFALIVFLLVMPFLTAGAVLIF
ncbi:MAG: rhomboid family intramembrane serine protease [Methanomicrobium sp.]|nr:rhomboid family intramembrane serine protease [Methanomicrobium sp.]